MFKKSKIKKIPKWNPSDSKHSAQCQFQLLHPTRVNNPEINTLEIKQMTRNQRMNEYCLKKHNAMEITLEKREIRPETHMT